jgi:hypothetical protein
MTPESCNLPIWWAGLIWARTRGNTEGAAAGTCFHSNEYDWRSRVTSMPRQRIQNVSVHTAKNLHSTLTARNVITLLLKEVISIWSDQKLPQGENWPTEDRQKLEEVRSKVFILFGVVIVTFRMLSLFVVTKCYIYSKTVLQLTVVPPGEYLINRLI